MIWLLPFACSAAICWWNRQHLVNTLAPARTLAPNAYGAQPYLLAAPQQPYLLPQTAGAYASPYMTSSAPAYASPPMPEGSYLPSPFHPEQGFAGPQYVPYDGTSPAPPPSAPQPIATLYCGTDACPIRPEPRAWDDATQGKMPGSFTAPRDYAVHILSYGPIGWANVLVDHPDEGAVEGWVETRFLAQAPSAPPASATSTPSTGQQTAQAAAKAAMRRDAAMRHTRFAARKAPVQQMRRA